MQKWGMAVALAGMLAAPAHVMAAGELDALKAQVQLDDEAKAVDAARKLGESSDPKAVDAILDALAAGLSPRVGASLLEALSGKKDARTVAVLLHYAKNRNPELRKKAVSVLAELPGDKALPALLDALSDSVEEVRASAALALGRRKEAKAEPRLFKLMQHHDEAAARALALMGTPELAHKLSELLGSVPDALLCTALGEMLKRPDFGPEPVRIEIVKTLAKVPGIDSTTALLEYVAASAKDKMRPSRAEAQKIIDQRSSQ